MISLSNNTKFKTIEESLFSNLDNITGGAYDNKAKMYERLVGSKLYNKIMWGTSPADYTTFAEQALNNSTGTVLDIGCGGLIQTANLYSRGKANYILLDNSIEMLKIGKQRIIDLCTKVPDTINFLQGDAFNLPFEDNSLDAVFSFGVLHVFENKKALIHEALRVLKPGHKFYFTSLTSDRVISKAYMNLLRGQKEFGEPLTSKQTLELFDPTRIDIESYVKGSMIFISGIKLH